jgi:hypothetical protein
MVAAVLAELEWGLVADSGIVVLVLVLETIIPVIKISLQACCR